MNIKHSWVDRNKGPVIVKIYRGDAPIDRTNLGTPLVTLTQGEIEWVDTTAVRNATYYYVYEAISANDRDVSQNVKVYANYRMGPGPNTFQLGDLNYGYLGELTSTEFISAAALMDAIKLTGFTITPEPNGGLKWHKWARNGKILFVPSASVATGGSWTHLYNAGAVYGTGDAGKGSFLPAPTVLQNARVKIGIDTFIVRLMTGYSDNLADVPETTTGDADPTDNFLCEWEDLIFPLFKYTPNKQRAVNVASGDRITMALGRGLCQERNNKDNCVIRGDASTTNARANVSNRGSISATFVNTWNRWHPVLELINE